MTYSTAISSGSTIATSQSTAPLNTSSSLTKISNNQEHVISKQEEVSDNSIRDLSPNTFALSSQKSLAIFHDLEPDDASAIVSIMQNYRPRSVSEQLKIQIISGGADARIQDARIKQYIRNLNDEKTISPAVDIEYAQGSDSEQKYLRHGFDVLTKPEINLIKDTRPTGLEKGKMLEFLRNNPESLVVMLKRPDELLSCINELPDLSKAKLIMYAGQFNALPAINSPDQFQKLTQKFGAVGLVQNYSMLQNKGDADTQGHKTPRDITPKSMPKFSAMLGNATNLTSSAIRNNTLIWNSKTLYEFIEKATNTDSRSIVNYDKQCDHEKAVQQLKNIITKYPSPQLFSENLNHSLSSTIEKAASMLDKTALMKNGKPLGFRVEVLRNVAESPSQQTVIADQLVSFAMIHPEKLENTVRGELKLGQFLSVEPNNDGNTIDLGIIKGLPGDGCDTTNSQKSRISEVEDFLVSTIFRSSSIEN